MALVFLSYSRVDEKYMNKVKKDLSSEGLQVWTDEKLTPGTEEWQRKIEKAIEDAECMVVILSPAAKKSEWVGREISYAQSQKVHIFPVLASGTEQNAVPIRLINTDWIDIRDDYQKPMKSLKSAIQKHLEELSSSRSKTSSPPAPAKPPPIQRSFGRLPLQGVDRTKFPKTNTGFADIIRSTQPGSRLSGEYRKVTPFSSLDESQEKSLAILRQGVAAWNRWRKQNPNIRPNLKGVNLYQANLKGVDFKETDLSEADLRRADLRWANLYNANLSGANLTGAKVTEQQLSAAIGFKGNLTSSFSDVSNRYRTILMKGAAAWNQWRKQNPNIRPNLRGVNLYQAKLKGADLREVDLSGADLRLADLRWANLHAANLNRANLKGAQVTREQLAAAANLKDVIMP